MTDDLPYPYSIAMESSIFSEKKLRAKLMAQLKFQGYTGGGFENLSRVTSGHTCDWYFLIGNTFCL